MIDLDSTNWSQIIFTKYISQRVNFKFISSFEIKVKHRLEKFYQVKFKVFFKLLQSFDR